MLVANPRTGSATDNYSYDANGSLTADRAHGIAHIQWLADRKVHSITRADGSVVQYTYDPLGHRIGKTVRPVGWPGFAYGTRYTLYRRDPQGSHLATDEYTLAPAPSLVAPIPAKTRQYRQQLLAYQLRQAHGSVATLLQPFMAQVCARSSLTPPCQPPPAPAPLLTLSGSAPSGSTTPLLTADYRSWGPLPSLSQDKLQLQHQQLATGQHQLRAATQCTGQATYSPPGPWATVA
ncbi:MAG: hypothetical protein ACK5XP_06220, partial [Sphingobacteriia bacterium]